MRKLNILTYLLPIKYCVKQFADVVAVCDAAAVPCVTIIASSISSAISAHSVSAAIHLTVYLTVRNDVLVNVVMLAGTLICLHSFLIVTETKLVVALVHVVPYVHLVDSVVNGLIVASIQG